MQAFPTLGPVFVSRRFVWQHVLISSPSKGSPTQISSLARKHGSLLRSNAYASYAFAYANMDHFFDPMPNAILQPRTPNPPSPTHYTTPPNWGCWVLVDCRQVCSSIETRWQISPLDLLFIFTVICTPAAPDQTRLWPQLPLQTVI